MGITETISNLLPSNWGNTALYILRQGRLWAQLPSLHARYDPIIRLTPNEGHI